MQNSILLTTSRMVQRFEDGGFLGAEHKRITRVEPVRQLFLSTALRSKVEY
jgi:hypothetical protein